MASKVLSSYQDVPYWEFEENLIQLDIYPKLRSIDITKSSRRYIHGDDGEPSGDPCRQWVYKFKVQILQN